MSGTIPGEQLQAVLLDGVQLEDVGKFKYPGSLFIGNAAFAHLKSCLRLRRQKNIAYKGQGLAGSGALNSALRLRCVSSMGSSQNDAGGL